MKRITVLGAGNGGQALAGHLASGGNSVTLFEHPRFEDKLTALKERGNITLKGSVKCIGKPDMITGDPEAAVKGAHILYLVAPTFAQKPILEMIAPYLEDGQILVLLPGNFGSLSFSKFMETKRIKADIMLAEADTIPYACRQVEPGLVDVWGMKKTMSMGSLPGKDIGKVIEGIRDYFPLPLKAAPNVIAIGLYNTNMILHCPTMIMNAGRIESEADGFSFYKDGMSESVCKVMEAMDEERIRIGKELGIKLLSTMEDMQNIYRIGGRTLRETILNNRAYCGHGKDSPSSMGHRYLNEDVPYLLVPLSEFGKLLDVPTPTVDSIIFLAGIVNGTDYFSSGINLEKLGLKGFSKEDIITFADSGIRR